ncbi:MAG: hypothetical protein QOE05_429 [Actinomycetota bacterium]|nr:hypothetical protein [Actinomycetota bacterium]
MRHGLRRPLALVAVLAAGGALALSAVPADAVSPTLTFGPNTFAYTADYGEPGLDIAPDGTVYATTPGDNGAVLAKSTDRGATWTKLPTARSTASQAVLKGGDSDVAVAKDGTVFAADLNVDGITVFRSTDGGKTFPHQVFINGTSDREWIAVDGPHGEDVYVTYHEIGTGTMLVAVSHDRGETFGPQQVVYSQPTTIAQSAHNGTSIGNITVDPHGYLYITYGTTRFTTTDTTYGSPPISSIQISISKDKGATWHDVDVNPGADDANFGNFWMANAVDTAGNVYAVYSGYAHKGEPMHVWLQQSSDHGETWTKPYAVDNALTGRPTGQDLFGWVAGGGPGVAVVSWYHTDAPNKDADGIDWVVPVAQVRKVDSTSPQVVYGIASDHSVHHGPICTLGTFCGILPGSSDDRTLLDFFKVDVAPDGMPAVVWSDNNRIDGGAKTGVGYARQLGGLSAFAPAVTTPPVTAPRPVAPPPAAPPPTAPGGNLATTGPSTTVPVLAVLLLLVGIGLRRRIGRPNGY